MSPIRFGIPTEYRRLKQIMGNLSNYFDYLLLNYCSNFPENLPLLTWKILVNTSPLGYGNP